jgi:Tfp pilus assembly protein PilF
LDKETKVIKKNFTVKETLTYALQMHKANNLKEAENLYKEILRAKPNHSETLFLLGSLLSQTNRFNLSKQLLNKVLEIQPNHISALNNLGNVLKELGEPKKALDCYHKAIQINPNYADAHNNLGVLFKESGEYQKAVNSYEKAIEIQPNKINAYNNLGIIHQEHGEMKKAINSYKNLSHIQSGSAEAHENIGRLYIVMGNISKAIDSYEEALKHEPENFVYYYHLSTLKKEILNLDLKKKLTKVINNSFAEKKNLAYANYLLSQYEQKNKNYKKEFDFLIKGHQLYFKSKEKRLKKEVEYWLDILPSSNNLLNFNNINKNIKKPDQEIKPIFIVGVPRSGSTLVEKIITSGVQYIESGEEIGVLGTFLKKKIITNQDINLKVENFQILLYEKYKEKGLINKKSNYTFTDKTLDNFFYISFIKKVFPKAKVINCKRDSLSSIMSILQNNLPAVPWAHDLDHIFKYFDIYYKTVNQFKKKFPDYIYDLKLENLVNNPEKESKKLMKFCNLPWDKKCLEFYKRKDLLSKTTSNIQIRKAINKSSITKYLPYKQFLIKYADRYDWFI